MYHEDLESEELTCFLKLNKYIAEDILIIEILDYINENFENEEKKRRKPVKSYTF